MKKLTGYQERMLGTVLAMLFAANSTDLKKEVPNFQTFIDGNIKEVQIGIFRLQRTGESFSIFMGNIDPNEHKNAEIDGINIVQLSSGRWHFNIPLERKSTG